MQSEPSSNADEGAAIESPAPHSRLHGAAVVWARLLMGGVALAAILGLFARWSALAEILTHFRAVYATAAVIATLLAVATRSWRLTALCAIVLVWALGGIVPWYFPSAPTAAAAGPTIKLLSANVSEHNDDHQRMLDLVAREQPDVVFVQEMSVGWSRAFADLYPHKVETPRLDYFGLGLYSKFPIENAVHDDPLGYNVPMMRADLIVDGRRIHILNLHLSPPESTTLIELRNEQYPWVTDYLAKHEGSVIVAGDLNCTMWSPLYTTLIARSDLVNAREGRGVMPSWLPLGPTNLLPLDHVFARGATIVNARLTERVGSDHTPILAEIQLAE